MSENTFEPVKIQVKNPENGEIVDINDNDLPELASKGYHIPNKNYVFEESGKRYEIPSSSFMDAVSKGYTYIPESKIREEKQAKEYDMPLAATGLGALRGVTFGLSDQALSKSGLIEEETLNKIKKYNPTSSIGGEVAGIVGPTILTGGAGLVAKGAAKTAPALIAKASEKIGEMGLRSLQNMGAKTASKVLSSVAKNKMAQAAIQTGITGAVEGALYGVGQTISEEALGNAEFNAETLLANAGIGGIGGGVLGGALGAVSYGAKVGRDKLNSKIRDFINKSDIDKDLKVKATSFLDQEEEVLRNLSALGKDEDVIKQTLDSAESLGVKLTPGMKTTDDTFRELESSLGKSPSIPGNMVKRDIQRAYDDMERVGNAILKNADDVPTSVIGGSGKEGIKATIENSLQPAKVQYQAIKEIMEETPVSESLKDAFTQKLSDTFYNRVTNRGKSYFDEIANLKSASDVGRYRSIVGKDMVKASRDGDYNALEFLGGLYDELTGLRVSALADASKAGVEKAGEALTALKSADGIYRDTYKKLGFLGDQFGIKSKNLDDLYGKIEALTDDQMAQKILSIKKPELAKRFEEIFPDIFAMARNKKVSEVAKKSMTKGQFSPVKFASNMDKLGDDQLKILFPHIKDIVKLKKDFINVANRLPPVINPSGTGLELALQGMMSAPYQAKEALRYLLYKSGPDGMLSGLMKMTPLFSMVEKSSTLISERVAKSINKFLDSNRRAITAEFNEIMPERKMNRANDVYKQITAPNAMLENFSMNNRDLKKYAPETSMFLMGKIGKASEFLLSKAPVKNDEYFNVEQMPSKSAMLSFSDYVDAVENPNNIFKQLSNGYVNPRYAEALKEVYPSIHQMLVEKMTDKIARKKLSYRQRVAIQTITGMRMTPSMSSTGFARLQGQSAQVQQPQQMQQTQGKIPVSANINQSLRNASDSDTISNRKLT